MEKNISYKILNMDKNDVPKVVQLDELSFGSHHWDSTSFYNELQNKLAHYYVVKTDEGELVGYIGFWIIFEEAHITNLSVNPNFRRQKIAQKLLIETIEKCYENMVKFITLEVRVSNIPAISLYEKFGFKTVGVRKGYYQNNNEDALIMFTNNIFYSQYRAIYDKIITETGGNNICHDKTFKR